MPDPDEDPTRTALHTQKDDSPPDVTPAAGETFPAEVQSLLGRLGLESSAAATTAALVPPGYTIEAELGRGGMGVVYLARQTALNRTVALKMILAGAHASALTQARFIIEAEAVAAIRHPHVVEVHDFGRIEGLPYFALEFVEGGTLADRLVKEGRFAPATAAELVEKLAAGMAAAHAKGIVHRDLKPANVLLTSTGEPKVTDFGLAKVGESDMTATGAVMGTPSYMSPEQAGGHTRDVGTHSDVWALGAILYELLTGRPPFRGDSIQGTLQQVLSRNPERPRASVHGIPRDLETICLKCLEKDPKKRYATADALASDLQAFREGRPIAARPVGTLGTVWRWRKRNPVLAAAAAITVFALVLGSMVSTAFGLWADSQARAAREAAVRADRSAENALHEKEIADAARDRAEEQKQNAEAAEQKAKSARNQADEQKKYAQASEQKAKTVREEALDTLYATSINLAHREWLHGLSYSARDLLAQAPQNRRGWEYDFLRGLFMPERRILRSTVQPTQAAATADGATIASASPRDTRIHLWDAATGLEFAAIPDAGRAHILRFASRGTHLACALASEIRVVDARTQRTVWKNTRLASPAAALNWSADGRSLHVVTLDGRYRRFDAATGQAEPAPSCTLGMEPLTSQFLAMGFVPAISADGKYFAAVYDDIDGVKVWDLTDGKLACSAPRDHERFIGQLSFSPDGKFIASPGGEGTVVVREVPSGRLVHRLRGHKSWVWSTAFSPDGRYLASGSKDTTARLWDVTTGETVQVYRGHQSEVWGVAFGGPNLMTYGPEGSIRLWDTVDPVLYSPHVLERARSKGLPLAGHSDVTDGMVLIHHSTPPADLAFSPDGRRIASSARDDNEAPFHIIVRDLVTRQESCRIATPAAAERDLAFSPDGRLLGALLHTKSGKKSATELRVYDSTTGKFLWNAIGPAATGASLGIRPPSGDFEANYQIDASTSVLIRYELGSGKELQKIAVAPAIQQPLYLDSGRRLLAASAKSETGDQPILELDPNTGAIVRSWSSGRPNLTASAASGRYLATAHASSGPADIVLWDADTGRPIRTFDGSIGTVTGLAFNPEGTRLLSIGSDFAARIWETSTGRQLLALTNHADVVLRAAWSRDGGRVATASMDGAVRVWSAEGSGTLPVVDGWEVLSPPTGHAIDPNIQGEVGGDWRIEGNQLVGTLRDLPGQGLAIAQVTLPALDLPRTVDIQVRVTVSQPMLIAIPLSNGARKLSFAPYISGVARPFGPGARLLVTNMNLAQPFSLQGIARSFPLEANRAYQFRVLRQEGRVRLFVDGTELVDEKIPELDLPVFHLQGSWSNAGDVIRFSQLVVRAPREAIRERKLHAKLERLYAEELLAGPVRARLEADPELSAGDRQALLTALAAMPTDLAALRTSARSLATKEKASPEELERARRQLQAAIELAGGQPTEETIGLFGLLATVEHRLGHWEAAATSLAPTLDFVLTHRGYLSLEELALAALVDHARGETESARRHLQHLRDLDRPEAIWENGNQPLVNEAKQLMERVLPLDPAREAIKETFLAAENAGWRQKDLEKYFAGRTADCIDVHQRSAKPGPYDVSLSPARMRARRDMEFQELNSDKARFLLVDWNVRITGDVAETTSSSVVIVPGGWTGRWTTSSQFKRIEGVWKIAGTRTYQTHQTEDGSFVELTEAYWAAKDRAVADAPDATRKFHALMAARRYPEAYALGRTVVSGEKAVADDWATYSKGAEFMGESAEAIRAVRKANELDPKAVPLPPWAKNNPK